MAKRTAHNASESQAWPPSPPPRQKTRLRMDMQDPCFENDAWAEPSCDSLAWWRTRGTWRESARQGGPDADTFKQILLGSPRCSCIFHVDVQDLCETNLIASNTSLPGYCCECMCSTLRLAFLEGCKLSRLPLRSVHFPTGSRHNSSGVPVLLQIVLHYDLGSCIFLIVLG